MLPRRKGWAAFYSFHSKEDFMKFSKFVGALLMALTVNVWAAVDINTASVADLDSIKGIGPGTSAKILDQRKNSKFKDWPDVIQRVSGIGEARAAKLSGEGLTVNGEKYKGTAGSSATSSSTTTTMAGKAKVDTKTGAQASATK